MDEAINLIISYIDNIVLWTNIHGLNINPNQAKPIDQESWLKQTKLIQRILIEEHSFYRLFHDDKVKHFGP